MAIHAGYLGEMQIPEERKEEFSARVLKILRQGGMMRSETIPFGGRKLRVLSVPAADADGKVAFGYSYFGDCEWEQAEYQTGEAKFCTGEVGSYEYQWVTSAVYVLYEFYAESFGMAEVNGELFDAVPYIAWLNQLFGETYTNRRATDPWRMYQLLHDCGYADGSEAVRAIRDLYEPEGGKLYALAEYLYVSGGPEEFRSWLTDGGVDVNRVEAGRIGLGQIILQAEPVIRELKQKCTKPDEEILEDLRAILLANPHEELEYDPVYAGFVVLLKLLSARIMAKATAMVFGLDFWTFWETVRDSAWDGVVWEERPEPVPEAIEAMTTAEFVDVSDEDVCFCRVEREVGEENYHTTDDDRVFWWRKDGDVHFSDGMWQWLDGLKTEFAAILAEGWETVPAGDVSARLAELLVEADTFYKRIYPFGEMIQEFEVHAGSREYQAAVRLLAALMDRNRAKGSVIGDTVYNWELADRNLTFNEGRLAIRRYLALLANRALREEVLGF